MSCQLFLYHFKAFCYHFFSFRLYSILSLLIGYHFTVNRPEFFISVSALQVFIDEVRASTEEMRNSVAAVASLRSGLRECESAMGIALRSFAAKTMTIGNTEKESDEVIREAVEVGGWPQYLMIGLLLSILMQILLMSNHLGVPRTAVSKFFQSFLI